MIFDARDPFDGFDDEVGEDAGAAAVLSVGDPETGKTRLLAGMCTTCVFRPGNQMHLTPGRLRDLVDETLRARSYIVCHSTLPGMAPDGVRPAVCRGFADRYDTQALQIIRRLFGFIEIDPPAMPDQPANRSEADAEADC
jgi:hypothetical protein